MQGRGWQGDTPTACASDADWPGLCTLNPPAAQGPAWDQSPGTRLSLMARCRPEACSQGWAMPHDCLAAWEERLQPECAGVAWRQRLPKGTEKGDGVRLPPQ